MIIKVNQTTLFGGNYVLRGGREVTKNCISVIFYKKYFTPYIYTLICLNFCCPFALFTVVHMFIVQRHEMINSK